MILLRRGRARVTMADAGHSRGYAQGKLDARYTA